MKNYFRTKIRNIATYIELFLSIFLIVIIVIFAVKFAVTVFRGISADTMQLDTILNYVLSLAIGIEFVKMLASHNAATVIEVLLFAIARYVIVGHDAGMMHTAVGVACIVAIFATRKFLFTHFDQTERNIFRGTLSVNFANRFSGAKIPEDSSHTLADVVSRKLKEAGETVAVGAVVEYKHCALRVDRMNSTRITRVEVIQKT